MQRKSQTNCIQTTHRAGPLLASVLATCAFAAPSFAETQATSAMNEVHQAWIHGDTAEIERSAKQVERCAAASSPRFAPHRFRRQRHFARSSYTVTRL